MSRMRLLAPAGGREQLEAAVKNGADAVYLGAGGFNARAGAENFGGGSLREAVAYCHGRGVKVHVTLNTLITDRETLPLLRQLQEIAESGADAVIVSHDRQHAARRRPQRIITQSHVTSQPSRITAPEDDKPHVYRPSGSSRAQCVERRARQLHAGRRRSGALRKRL